MMTISRLFQSVGTALFACFFIFNSNGFASPSSDQERTYHKAWQLVRDTYYDPGYNGQNWSSWEHRFDGKLSGEASTTRAIETMLDSLNDQYTRVLDSKTFADEVKLIDNRLVGIGVVLDDSHQAGHMFIAEALNDSPAARAGIRAGDELVAVDGHPISGLTVEDVGSKVSGKIGTVVAVAINRDNCERTVKIKRERLVLNSVSYRVLQPNIGYINISSFLCDDAARSFKNALRKLAKTDGLIIDIRHNSGGLISNAIEISSMLLEKGPIVTTIARQDKDTDVASGSPLTNKPIVLLVDRDSASASEILAAALKDHERAVLVGTQTFGKGVVQQIFPLPGGGAVHVTVARYVGPHGQEINKVGVAPNIVAEDESRQMDIAMTLLKSRITAENRGQAGSPSVQSQKARS